MAHCLFSLVASAATLFTTIMYLAAFGADWWILTKENRANLFSYTLSTTGKSNDVSYDWTYMCSNPDCLDCRGVSAAASSCDSRPAEVSCPPGLPSPASWCHAFTDDSCKNMFQLACSVSVDYFYDDDDYDDWRKAKRGCTEVTYVAKACRHAQNCAAMIGVAMGFGLLTAALGIVVWILSCRGKRSKHARRWAMAVTALLFVEFVFGLTGFSLGHIWTGELPETDYRPGLWCSLVAFLSNIVAFVFFLGVAALNDSEDES